MLMIGIISNNDNVIIIAELPGSIAALLVNIVIGSSVRSLPPGARGWGGGGEGPGGGVVLLPLPAKPTPPENLGHFHVHFNSRPSSLHLP